MAEMNACSATRSVIHSAASRDGQSLASFRATSLGFGNRKIGTCAVRHTISHSTTMTSPTASGAAIVIAVSDCASGRMVRSLSSALHLLQGHLGQRGRQRAAVLGEARSIAEALVARMRLVDRHDLADPAGLRAHDDDARREEHRLVDRMRDKDGGQLALPPQANE